MTPEKAVGAADGMRDFFDATGSYWRLLEKSSRPATILQVSGAEDTEASRPVRRTWLSCSLLASPSQRSLRLCGEYFGFADVACGHRRSMPDASDCCGESRAKQSRTGRTDRASVRWGLLRRCAPRNDRWGVDPLALPRCGKKVAVRPDDRLREAVGNDPVRNGALSGVGETMLKEIQGQGCPGCEMKLDRGTGCLSVSDAP